MSFLIREFLPDDIEKAVDLWRVTPGIGLSSADEPQRIQTYLERNPGLSFTAWKDAVMVGAVLCGHDGRRGFLHHLVVHPDYRRQGLGHLLVESCHSALRNIGIERVHIFVYHDNHAALEFWQDENYYLRHDLALLSADIKPE